MAKGVFVLSKAGRCAIINVNSMGAVKKSEKIKICVRKF